MHRILLLDDKSLTWHAVTGQPRATAPASDSWGWGGDRSDWTAALLFQLESGPSGIRENRARAGVKGDYGASLESTSAVTSSWNQSQNKALTPRQRIQTFL